MASNKLQEVKNRLYNLEKLNVGTPEHAQLLKDIMDHLKPHIEGEEHNDFPKLEKAIGVQGSKEAAASFARTKKFVPTRYAHLCFIIFQTIRYLPPHLAPIPARQTSPLLKL